jgi:Rieske Fe-S protein
MDFADSPLPRQKVIAGAGLALAAGALAACAGHAANTQDVTGSPAGSPSAPGSAQATGVPGKVITTTSAVPVGSGVIVGDIVITQPTSGVFKGLSSTCTHAGCTVSEVAGGTINCPCHGSRYNLDGSVATGPATRPLAPQAVSVQGDSVVRGGGG